MSAQTLPTVYLPSLLHEVSDALAVTELACEALRGAWRTADRLDTAQALQGDALQAWTRGEEFLEQAEACLAEAGACEGILTWMSENGDITGTGLARNLEREDYALTQVDDARSSLRAAAAELRNARYYLGRWLP